MPGLRRWAPAPTTAALPRMEPYSAGTLSGRTGGKDSPVGCGAVGSDACRNNELYGRASPQEGERFLEVTGGRSHTCALREDGVAVCWGLNIETEPGPLVWPGITARRRALQVHLSRPSLHLWVAPRRHCRLLGQEPPHSGAGTHRIQGRTRRELRIRRHGLGIQLWPSR